MIKTVVFDIDGTMYDYERGNQLAIAALEDYGVAKMGSDGVEFRRALKEADDILKRRIGYDCASIHNRLIRFQCLLEQLKQPLFPHAMNLYRIYWGTLLDQMEASPGLLEWMRCLKSAGIGIGVGTNMTAYIQYKKLERLGVESLIDWIVTSEEAGVQKPERRFFDLCIKKSQNQAGECLFVGENQRCDVDGPRKAGMKALLFGVKKSGCSSVETFEECLVEGFLEGL